MSQPQPKTTTQKGALHPDTGATMTLSTTTIVYEEGEDATADTKRRKDPDTTGFYESVQPADGSNSIRTLQLLQAGHIILGIVSMPPGFVPLAHSFAVGIAALVIDLDLKSGKGFSFYFKEGTKDPLDVLSPFKPFDLSDIPSDIGSGIIDISGSAPDLQVTLTFYRTKGDKAQIRFNQTNTVARVSARTINGQTGAIRRWLEAMHRTPAPSSYFDVSKPSGEHWAKALSLFSSNSPLAQLISKYVVATRVLTPAPKASTAPQISGKFAQKAPRTGPSLVDRLVNSHLPTDNVELISIIEEIENLFTRARRWGGYDHAQILDLQLTKLSLQQKLSIEGQERSFSEWLAFIMGYEASIRPNAPVPQAFARLLAGTTTYRYEFKFSTLSLNIPITPVISSAVGLFGVSIAGFVGTRETDGAVKEWKKIAESVDFLGGFFELKAGTGNPPKLPESIMFPSSVMLQPGEFDGAVFEIFSLEALIEPSFAMSDSLVKAGVMPSAGAKGQAMRIYAKNVILEGTCDSVTIVPTFKYLKSNLKWETAQNMLSGRGEGPKIEAKYSAKKPWDILNVGASLGGGLLFRLRANRVKWIVPPPRVADSQVELAAQCKTPAGFELGKYDISRELNGWSVRKLLEALVANERALFRKAISVKVTGFASPEGTPKYNRWLGASRAKAVLQAVEDCVGAFPDDVKDATGVGDEVAINQGGFTDPDPGPKRDPKAVEKFKREHKEEVSRWPLERKVEVEVDGRVMLAVTTVEPPKVGGGS